MPGEDGKVVFSYEGDTSGIDKANAEAESKVKSGGKAVQNAVKGTADAAGEGAAESTKKTSSIMTGVLQGIGQAAAGFAVKAGGALVDFGKQGIELASDLAEVQNVVDTTFGANASKINTFSKQAANQFGLSELQAKQYSSTLGAMFKSMGTGADATLKMSEGLTGLAGDIASFYNLDPEEAFEKLKSGITGETEPLKALGINMSDANLQAFALSQGIKTQTKDMSQAQLATLRYQYLMQATSDAQGDFAKTGDSYANQQRKFQMNMQTLSTVIGSALLPVLNTVFSTLNSSMPELQSTLQEVMKPLGEMLTTILPPLMQLISAVLPPLMQLISAVLPPLAALLKMLLPPLIEILNLILPPLVEILSAIISGPLMDLLNMVMPAIVAALKLVISVLQILMPIIKWTARVITDYLASAFNALRPIITAVIGIINGLISFIKNVFTGNWAGAWQAVLSIFSNIWNGFGAILKWPINGAISLINAFLRGLNRIRLPDWMGGFGVHIPLIPHLAKGGLAFGPTLALVGDNPGASVDPEVVSPMSKLQQYISAAVSANVAAAPANVTVIVQPAPVNLDGRTIAGNTAQHQFTNAAIKGVKQ